VRVFFRAITSELQRTVYDDRDWENEIACYSDIEPLDELLIEALPVTEERYREFEERREQASNLLGSRPHISLYTL
jgi:hypothetical protein